MSAESTFGYKEDSSKSRSKSFIDPTQAGYLNSLWQNSSNFIDGGGGAVNPMQQNYALNMTANNPYMQSLASFSNPNNDLMNRQIDSLSQSLGEQFNNQIMPGIASGAQMAGQFGGARQGVAEAQAAGQFADAFASGATSIMSNAYNTANQAAMFGAQQYANNAMQYNDMLTSQQAQNMMPYLTLSQILGSPTVLNKSKQSSEGYGFNSSNKGGIGG